MQKFFFLFGRYASKSTINMSGWDSFFNWHNMKHKLEFVDPRGYVNISWLLLLTLVFLYNAWVIPLRAIFPFARTRYSAVDMA